MTIVCGAKLLANDFVSVHGVVDVQDLIVLAEYLSINTDDVNDVSSSE